MARGALLTGTAGGILGSVATGLGVMWSIVFMMFAVDLYNYIQYLIESLGFAIFFIPYPSSSVLFSNFLLLVSLLLIVAGILTGVGFYGVYKAGGGAMGMVGLISAVVGSVAGVLFLIMGVLTQAYIYIYIIMPYFFVPFPPFYFPFFVWAVPTPNYGFIWIGFIILAVTFIVLGAASIAIRNGTANSSASVAAGIVGIIGACFWVPFILIALVPAVPWLAGVFTLIGFTLIFVAFILWAAVFFSSREM